MSFENPASILFDTKGVELAVSRSQALATTLTGSGANAGILTAGSGSDGKVNFWRIDNDGTGWVTGSVTAYLAGPDATNNQGNHGTADESWYMVITDGTSSTALGSAKANSLWTTGSMQVFNNPSTPIHVTGSVILGEQPIQVTGSLTTVPDKCPTAVVSGTNATTSTITLLAANTARCGAIFHYLGPKNVYLKFGAGASSSDFTVKLSALGYYELPYNYTGIISAVWDSAEGANNFIQTTEVTNP